MQFKDNQTEAANQLAKPPAPATPKPAGDDGMVVTLPTGQRIELGENSRQTKIIDPKKT
ncbi:MAG: hypothetical protein V1716_02660 [Candidatus Uhrbacteria bacterium]